VLHRAVYSESKVRVLFWHSRWWPTPSWISSQRHMTLISNRTYFADKYCERLLSSSKSTVLFRKWIWRPPPSWILSWSHQVPWVILFCDNNYSYLHFNFDEILFTGSMCRLFCRMWLGFQHLGCCLGDVTSNNILKWFKHIKYRHFLASIHVLWAIKRLNPSKRSVAICMCKNTIKEWENTS